ncbi:MAG: MBL fold metallo-hydrolase [Elusimicrobia bacterium]|nr:MBL fold metallo-hydrolase [Elusimicrobiota bacterium]
MRDMATDGRKAWVASLAVLLGMSAWTLPTRARASDTLESLASRDPLAGLSVSSFLGPDGRGMVISRSDSVEVFLPGPGTAGAAGLSVFFVSVGQGDAEYIELPDGRNALIDGGPADSSGSAIPPIAKFLAGRGVTKIDHVVLTHPHADHYAGLGYVFDNFQVGRFYDTRIDNSGATGDDLVRQKAAAEPGCASVHPAPGDSLDWAPGVAVRVLNSCPEPSRSSDVEMGASEVINNCSIVLKVVYGGSSVLFTGDVQDDVEARLASEYGDELRADVLKVGHHGSKHSSSAAFLDKVRPDLAYIEVGRNSYGHPAETAVARLQAVGASVRRTDRDGTQEYAVAPSTQGGDGATEVPVAAAGFFAGR